LPLLGVELLILLMVHTGSWLGANIERARRLETVEVLTRQAIGEWLGRNTPDDAVVAAEPIGYIGYYSRRRILDLVGLVSPAMIPINRLGDGWFGQAMRRFRPDYVVERDYFLRKNSTINVPQVSMFSSAADQQWFEGHYSLVHRYRGDAYGLLTRSYCFKLFRRRDLSAPSPASAVERPGPGWESRKNSKSSIRRSNR
jgi:hypothetical protein